MTTGTYISGAAHLALVAWMLLGGLLIPEAALVKPQTTDVSLISANEFAALTVSESVPELTQDLSRPAPPEIDVITAPVPRPEPVPVLPAASAPGTPTDPDTVPVVPEEPAPAAAELSQDVAVLLMPQPEPNTNPPDISASDDALTPRAAPRVAPMPVLENPLTPEIAETPTPTVSPDAATDRRAPDAPAASPEEATTEIVTEAETQTSSAPATSRRPVARPARTTPTVETPDDAITGAVAEAVAGGAPINPEPAAAPSGPPLTQGERDALRVAVQQCWNVGSLSSDALEVTVVVAFSMTREGRPESGSIRMLRATGGSDSAARQAFETARRAIIRCGSHGYGLPPEKFSRWRDIEITFNPENMRNK